MFSDFRAPVHDLDCALLAKRSEQLDNEERIASCIRHFREQRGARLDSDQVGYESRDSLLVKPFQDQVPRAIAYEQVDDPLELGHARQRS